jgi:hypothetical protein
VLFAADIIERTLETIGEGIGGASISPTTITKSGRIDEGCKSEVI